jgi:putative membrane protein
MYGMGGYYGFWWIIAIAIIVGIVWAIARTNRSGMSRGDSPEAILKRRYASGEIDKDQYEKMLADLRR